MIKFFYNTLVISGFYFLFWFLGVKECFLEITGIFLLYKFLSMSSSIDEMDSLTNEIVRLTDENVISINKMKESIDEIENFIDEINKKSGLVCLPIFSRSEKIGIFFTFNLDF